MNRNELQRRQIESISYLTAIVIAWIFENKIHENGLAYFLLTMLTVYFLWNLVGANIGNVAGKMIKGRAAKGQYKNANLLKRSLFVLQMVLGIIAFLILVFGAEMISESCFHSGYCVLLIRLVAPFVVLHCISVCLSAYLIGSGRDLSVGIGAILRQIFILSFGSIIGTMFSAYGSKVSALLIKDQFEEMYAVAGIMIGIVIAELFVVLYLTLCYKGFSGKLRNTGEGMRSTESAFDQFRIMYGAVLPVMIIRILQALPIFLGCSMLLGRAENVDEAMVVLGEGISGFLLICLFIAILSMSSFLVNQIKIVSSLKKDETRFARNYFQSGMHMCFVIGLFFSVFMTIMSEQISGLLPGDVSVAKMLLSGCSFAVLLLVLYVYFAGLLMRVGQKVIGIFINGISNVVFFVMIKVFEKNHHLDLKTLIYAIMISLTIACVLYSLILIRQLKIGLDMIWFIVIPSLAISVVGLLCMVMRNLFTPHLGIAATIVISGIISMLIYMTILMCLRNFKEYEFQMIPGGKVLRTIGEILHIL